MFEFPCIITLYITIYKEPTRCNFGSIVYYSLQNYSTSFGRFLHPSSGALTTVEAATGACHVWVSVHHKSILYKEPTRCNFGSIVYYSLQNYSTCFGRFLSPSSGVLTTVEAATGACHVWVSVHHNSILYKKPTRCNFGSIVYYSLQNYSTCFGRFLRPSSGVLTNLEAATVL